MRNDGPFTWLFIARKIKKKQIYVLNVQLFVGMKQTADFPP